jgi:Archaeal fructose-1,6-bisphosphatase and related enzymes of inositol monophosphatase family
MLGVVSFRLSRVSGIYDSHPDFLSLPIFRDVAAGIAIVQEAGGLVTTANPPDDLENAPIEDARLGSRLYLAIR